jgi:transaldolase
VDIATISRTDRLRRLYEEHGQSPWLDNLRRGWITSGQLQALVDAGIRGITSNPTIFAKSMTDSEDYDRPLRSLVGEGASVDDAYWALVTDDIAEALRLLRPVHDASGGEDGFVSVEVSPLLAHDQAGTVTAARHLHQRIDAPNLYVKVPATAEGVGAVRSLVAEGHSINVTLIFGLDRYREVIEAYQAGLEELAARHPDRDLSGVSSVASFFVSRVDTEIDRRLDQIGTPEALALRGQAAMAQAKLAYQVFLDRFRGPRWEVLAARGARHQRPLWASTSTKDPAYPDTVYVDRLIGPRTVNTMPEATLAAFADHGTLARTVDVDVDGARQVVDRLAELGIAMDEVAAKLEVEGVASFAKSFDDLLDRLAQRADSFRGEGAQPR